MSPVISQILSKRVHAVILRNLALSLACVSVAWSQIVDLRQFTPGANLINYSVYTTDSISLPAQSGLATGGIVGTGGGISFSNQMQLRSPLLTAGRDVVWGSNTINGVGKTSILGSLTVGNNNIFNDTLQVGGNLISAGTHIALLAPTAIGGNLSLSGTDLGDSALLRLKGTYVAPSMTFGASAQVRMAAATGGPGALTFPQLQYNIAFANFLPAPLTVGAASLPASTVYKTVGTTTSAWTHPGGTNINILGPANTAVEAAVPYVTVAPDGTVSNWTGYYWRCSIEGVAAGLSASSCHGDTLLPGSYGSLTMGGGNWRALLLKDGFYSFDSIKIGATESIIAAQPTGGRTVIFTQGNITTTGSNSFIGPDGARLATSYGSGAGQFLGGTMMLTSRSNINLPSDLQIWATLSAPYGDVHLTSQVNLFGQIYAKRLIGDNMIDFGKGAFIAFRGEVPALTGPTFKVGEKADTSCHDTSGRACRDTLITLKISAVTAYQGSVHYEIVESSPRSARAGTDFSADTGTLVFPINTTTKQLRVRIFNDSSYEGPETFRIVFSNPVSLGFLNAKGAVDTLIKSYQINGTIIDDDLAPLVKIISDSAVKEGNSGAHPSSFTVRLYDPNYPANPLSAKNAPQLSVAFRWHTVDGSATVSDSDYIGQSSRWDTIPALALSKSISVTVKGDLRYENDEAFKVVVDSVVNGTLPGGSVSDSGVIKNDDVAPTVNVSGISVQEPAKYGDTAWATFTYRISAPSGLTTTIAWHTQDGTAKGATNFSKNPADYLTNSGSFSIPHDSLTGTVSVAVFGDTLYEKNEFFKLSTDSIRNGFIGDTTATATIVDADSAPTVSVSNATIREPSAGTSIVRLPVHLSRPSALPASFVWNTKDGSATQGLDYKAVVSDTVRLPAFLRDTVLEVVVYSDSVAGEGDETFSVNLSGLVDLRPGTLSATGTIQDAQTGFHLAVDSIGPVAEADSLVRFNARLDWVPATDIRVVYHAQAGSARGGERYADTSGVVVFRAGSRTASFAVRLTTDSLWEPLEYFSLRLDSINGSLVPVVTDSVARAWIHEGAALVVTYATPDDTVREDTAGTVPVKIRLSQPTSFAFKVRVPLLSGSTASYSSDFTYKGASGDTIVVPAGNRTWSFGVAVVADTIVESDEIATLGLVPVDSGEAGRPNVWSLTILDDDHKLKVVILTPPDKIHTKDTLQHITWTVDGKDQPAKDTVFTKPGWNCVDRSATDRFGRVYSAENCIWLDITPPKVTVFKITGWNPHDRTQDTTWWGDLAKTRYGKDTIWYEVRDSIQNSDGKSWQVLLDTLFSLTDFRVDGLHPTQVKACDSVGNCGIDTGWIDLKMSLPHAESGVYLDRNGDGRIDAMIVNLSGAWNADFLPTFDAPLPPEIRHGLKLDSIRPYVTISGSKDYSRFVVPIVEPFRFGATGFDSLYGVMWETWTTGKANPDSFAIRDSVAPVILKAVVSRVEKYNAPDTVFVTASETLRLSGKSWLQVGICPDDRSTCPDSLLVWHAVPADSVQKLSDGRYWFLVPPGDSGSVEPGIKIRFQDGVSDSLGNKIDTTNLHWATLVEGAPRPDLVRVTVPNRIPFIPSSERDRSAPGGVLIRATSGKVIGDSVNRSWWEPGRGYIGGQDPSVRSICPDLAYCNGPTLYINRPVRIIIYIYDNGGTYVMSRTVDITQNDIEQMNPDQIDRLSIELDWNHRTTEGKLVSTGVYVWRIVSYVKVEGLPSPVIQNQLFKLGVNIRPPGGLF